MLNWQYAAPHWPGLGCGSIRPKVLRRGYRSGLLCGLALFGIALAGCDDEPGRDAAKRLNQHYKSVELAEGWQIDSVANTRNGIQVKVGIPRSAAGSSHDELLGQLKAACPGKTERVWDLLKPNQGITVEGQGGGLDEPIRLYCPGPV